MRSWQIAQSRRRLERLLDVLDSKRDSVASMLMTVRAIERNPALLKDVKTQRQVKVLLSQKKKKAS